mmetsp:Transcript_50435/g.134044  ORF Transcript_50435/g.134044 Transcript_50435/m.134044 type:complete len:250 (+) Transcript_50435:1149-1898(+)
MRVRVLRELSHHAQVAMNGHLRIRNVVVDTVQHPVFGAIPILIPPREERLSLLGRLAICRGDVARLQENHEISGENVFHGLLVHVGAWVDIIELQFQLQSIHRFLVHQLVQCGGHRGELVQMHACTETVFKQILKSFGRRICGISVGLQSCERPTVQLNEEAMQHVARGASTHRVRRHVLHDVVLGTECLNVFGEMVVSPQIVVKDGPHLLPVRLSNVQEACRMSDVYKVRNATQSEDGHIGPIPNSDA